MVQMMVRFSFFAKLLITFMTRSALALSSPLVGSSGDGG